MTAFLIAVFTAASVFAVGFSWVSSWAAVTTTARKSDRGSRRSLARGCAQMIAQRVPKPLGVWISRSIVMAGGLSGLGASGFMLRVLLAGGSGLVLGVCFVFITASSVWFSSVAFCLSCLLPFLWLRDRVKQRHFAILREMPYQLDLLTLSVEAGLDFAAAIAKVVERGKRGPLRDELAQMLAEVRMGKTRAEAMEHMSQRVGLPALSTFLSAMISVDRLGVGVGKTLRAHSEQLRIERFQRAEKSAGEAPVKMLIPLVVFVFPTIWIVLAAPLVFQWLYQGASG